MSFIDFEKERVRRDEIAESNLMDAGLVSRKKQAQKALKYHLRIGTLFTLRDTRPQQYYPSDKDLKW